MQGKYRIVGESAIFNFARRVILIFTMPSHRLCGHSLKREAIFLLTIIRTDKAIYPFTVFARKSVRADEAIHKTVKYLKMQNSQNLHKYFLNAESKRF